jgi:type I restriction enzyme R subunit
MTDYSEYTDSQKPAIELLQKLGYSYLSPEQALQMRGGLYSNVLLEDILAERLAAINSFEYKGDVHPFSSTNINAAINALRTVPDEGLVRTNEKVYDLLTLGKSFVETIHGDQKSYTIRYIDWENIENNHFHITEEFTVEGIKEKRRPDIVLFVNGIPFVVIENKRRDKNNSITESISQHIRNQKKEEGIPRLFHYAQLLLAVQPNEVKYGTTGTPAKFWSVWKEDNEAATKELTVPRIPTEQDRSLLSLCHPERLIDLCYKFTVFDGPDKKVARYQQYFAIKATVDRVTANTSEGAREGGVVWHTQGSGKSLTMVMLSKSLALEPSITDPRVIIVTDRISLDKQIHDTFVHCGKHVKKAKSGNNLIELLEDKGIEVITSIIDKFETALKRDDFKDYSQNLFILVDESHRSQFGSSHAKMKRMLPNACYIGFTGTPLMAGEKQTARKFGSFIHSYTIDQAVKDGAVLPLLYEGRAAKLSVNKKQIDKGFDRLSADLNEEATKDLKKKFARISKIYESQQVVEEIAYDIAEHFCKNWKGTGFKAQLVVPKIDTAIRYQKYFENEVNPDFKVNTRVIFTPPDSRTGHYDVQEDPKEEGKKYWKKITEQYGNQEAYEDYAIGKFKEAGNEVELIIVVAKLLTGFDAPRNTVLYLAKPIHSHNLLQAIARVNRLFEGKEHGYVIDYVGLLGKLDEALTTYSAFEDYDGEDVENAVFDIREEVRKLPARHAEVWDVFKGISNRKDIESLERHVAPKDIRDNFYKRLTSYGKALHTALSSDEFYVEFTDQQIIFYKKEFRDFIKLKKSIQQRYSEVVDYAEYEAKVRKLLDTHIKVDNVYSVTGEVDIFDKNMVQEEMAKYGQTPASKADMIASKMKKVFTEKMEQDEAFYKKFSELLEQTIKAFRDERIDEKKYLERVLSLQEDFSTGYQEGIPANVQNNEKARAFFGAVKLCIVDKIVGDSKSEIDTKLGQAGIDISTIVEKLTIRDWKKNIDIQRQMENEIEDYLIAKRSTLGIELSFDDIDQILAKALKIAKNNY